MRPEKRQLDKFVKEKLFSDAFTLLRLISANCSEMAASEVIYALWKRYKDELNSDDDVRNKHGMPPLCDCADCLQKAFMPEKPKRKVFFFSFLLKEF